MERVRRPLTAIATRSGTPARTMFRIAERHMSWKSCLAKPDQGGRQVRSNASQVADETGHTSAKICAQVVPMGTGTAQTLVPHAAVMKQSGVVHGMTLTMAQMVGSVSVGMQISTQQTSPQT